jgi:hypothetical protein
MVHNLSPFPLLRAAQFALSCAGACKGNREMRNSVKSGSLVIAVSFAVVVLVIALVALIRCPAADIPAVIRAFGSWLRISIPI